MPKPQTPHAPWLYQQQLRLKLSKCTASTLCQCAYMICIYLLYIWSYNCMQWLHIYIYIIKKYIFQLACLDSFSTPWSWTLDNPGLLYSIGFFHSSCEVATSPGLENTCISNNKEVADGVQEKSTTQKVVSQHIKRWCAKFSKGAINRVRRSPAALQQARPWRARPSNTLECKGQSLLADYISRLLLKGSVTVNSL